MELGEIIVHLTVWFLAFSVLLHCIALAVVLWVCYCVLVRFKIVEIRRE